MITQAICPACGAANRIAAGRPAKAAKCGKCGANLSLHAPTEVDDEKFQRHLDKTRGPVLVDIWAPWCGPCQAMTPQFASAADRLAGQARLLKLNADTTSTPSTLGVSGIPALILFSGGKEIDRRAGLVNADELVRWVESAAPS